MKLSILKRQVSPSSFTLSNVNSIGKKKVLIQGVSCMEGKHVQEIVFEMSMHVNKMYMSGPSGRDTVIEAQCFEKTDFPISFILSL